MKRLTAGSENFGERCAMRHFKVIFTMIVLSVLISATVYAGQWEKNELGWWYNNGDGTWPANTWQWLDENNDGVAECYYFDQDGYCLINTNTPDGWIVNENGAWIINGIVQTQNVGISMPAINNISQTQVSAGQERQTTDETSIMAMILYKWIHTHLKDESSFQISSIFTDQIGAGVAMMYSANTGIGKNVSRVAIIFKGKHANYDYTIYRYRVYTDPSFQPVYFDANTIASGAEMIDLKNYKIKFVTV